MHMCMCDGGVYNVNRRKGFVFVCDFAVLWSISKMIPVSLFFKIKSMILVVTLKGTCFVSSPLLLQ